MLLASFFRSFLKHGTLTLIDTRGQRHLVDSGNPGPSVVMRLHSRRAERRMLLNARLALGECYMDGSLTIDNGTIYDFLDLVGRSIGAFERHPLNRLLSRAGQLFRALQQHNPIERAQRNVAHHYDLSDTLYDLFLDRDRQYSCAYFISPDDSLEQAQDNKKKHLVAKLDLRPGMRLLDIGCGWGGLGLYLAANHGADVTGLTLSAQQLAVAQRRAGEAGIEDRCRFALRDYRLDQGPYDRIVSVGMFEHVGAVHYREFFNKVSTLLSEDGVFVLHAIGRMEPPGATNPWLRKYIFPGGYSPALSEVLAAIEHSGLWVTDIEILRLHYAQTLRHWRERFAANRPRIAALYDERFCRMWEFYLAACEAAFRYMRQFVFQMQITRRQDAVPLTRDYIYEAERKQPRSMAAE